MERSLDVRTLLCMQSVLVALSKVNFNKRHLSLLKGQRHARTINLLEDNETASDTSIIYGDDVEQKNIDNKSMIYESQNQNQLQTDCMNSQLDASISVSEQPLSPRSQILYQGTYSKVKNQQLLRQSAFNNDQKKPFSNIQDLVELRTKPR